MPDGDIAYSALRIGFVHLMYFTLLPNMKRRQFTAALVGLLCLSSRAYGSGNVFLDYDQAALDQAYDQRNWAPNFAEVIARYRTDSAAARAQFPPRTEHYGPGDETLDIFSPPVTQPGRKLPVMVFVHGGAWRALSKDDASAPAGTFVSNGCLYVALNFSNIPVVRLPEMAKQCQQAILWLYANIERFGGDSNRIFVSGHSSGGHLCAVLLTTDWPSLGAPKDVIKGGVAMSGMYDLYPVMKSSRSSYIKLLGDEMAELSPMRHLDKIRCPVIVVSGDKESPEFKRQAADFATALAGMGMLKQRFILADCNHFEVPEALNNQRSPLSAAVLKMMS
ncbi:alpha/beta hydrolase [Herbaspirillum sp.]|uniref:alpha/beta hydrolase n=1 Tax=Herbaspirillum sp. TaxID=1890675 RepID=UPI0031DA4CB7